MCLCFISTAAGGEAAGGVSGVSALSRGSSERFPAEFHFETGKRAWQTHMVSENYLFPDKLAVDLSLYWRGCFEFRPSVLDNFALLSGQLNTINKVLKNEKTPSYRSQVIIPLLLSPDRDEELVVSGFTESLCLWQRNWLFKMLLLLLQKITEQRVPVFSHEIVPDHLRTKPDPEVEEQEKHLSAEAARIGPEVAQVNKHMSLLYLT